MPSRQPSHLAKVAIDAQRSGDALILSNRIALGPYPRTIIEPLLRWQKASPEAAFLKERDGAGWRSIGYAEFARRAQERAARILQLGCNENSPLLILAANSIEHALTGMAAMIAGVPVSPISPTYGIGSDFARLRQLVDILQPGAAWVGDAAAFGPAARAIQEVVRVPVVSPVAGEGIQELDTLPPVERAALERARAAVGPDSVAKILFTSGSTGTPKGVINTHSMLCSNVAALSQLLLFLHDQPPVLVDWMPWSHTFGGNVCFNLALLHGGVLHIDDGKPTPALIGRTVENLKLAPPSLLFNVPAGIEALIQRFETDEAFARTFFAETRVFFVAAAALPQRARDRLAVLCEEATGEKPTLLSGWGSTETAPAATCLYFDTDDAANFGLPVPGTAIKMQPQDGKLALLVKGPNVMPGYWRNPAATRAAFDQDGFYAMGDAGRLVDPNDPARGIAFDGRISENFKLTSGTWVNVGMLRVRIVDCLRPLCMDVVVTGENQDDVGLLVIPNLGHAAQLAGAPASTLNPATLAAGAFGEQLTQALRRHNREQRGSSTRIARLAILARAPDLAKHEITDKGYLNQRVMLANHRATVELLHGPAADSDSANGILRL